MSSNSCCNHGSVIQVMTSVDLVSHILANFIPPDSSFTQAWFSSLALVHPSWSQPVFFALHQHPMITSITQFLSFQDSFRIHLDRLELLIKNKLHERLDVHMKYARTGVPSACAVRSMVINFFPPNIRSDGPLDFALHENLGRQIKLAKELYIDPGFCGSLSHLSLIHLSVVKISINNFTFLLSNLSRSLVELGVHDVNFIGSNDTTQIFDAIFDLLHLRSLCLTGWLASAFYLLPLLQTNPEAMDAKQSLETLSLSDTGLKCMGAILKPQQLSSCWDSCSKTNHKTISLGEEDHVETRSTHKYPNPLKIKSYRLCTSSQAWHDPRIMKDLRDHANQLGIDVEVAHHLDVLERIQWMSQHR